MRINNRGSGAMFVARANHDAWSIHPRLRLIPSFLMVQPMAETLEQIEAKPVTRRSVFVFRFASTIVLWSVSLGIVFSGYELAFFALIGTCGLIALWEFYGMLDHKGLPNFKVTAMLCGTVMLCGSFYYFSKLGPGHSYDFEMAVLLFFLLTVFTRQMFERLRDDAPLQTMAYTLFGLLYVLWLFNFITKIVYVVPRSPTGAVTGQFYCLYLIAITKFSDMGAYLTGSLIGRHPLIPHISPKKTWEGFAGALFFSLLASWGLFSLCHRIFRCSPGRTPPFSDCCSGSRRSSVISLNRSSNAAPV